MAAPRSAPDRATLIDTKERTMGIPPIDAYDMPCEDDLPLDTVDWQASASRAVLLVHDMQNYFLKHFPAGQSPLTDLLRNIERLRERCSALDIPIIYTAQPGSMTAQQRGLLKDFWGPGMTTDAAHREIAASIAPSVHDRSITKWRYSAFHHSDLLAILRGAGRDQLVICGVYAHVGCLMTAADALANDVQAFLVADAVADFSLTDHRMAIAYASRRCAATPVTDRVLAQLDGRTRTTYSSLQAKEAET
jgi:isochorismate hydrolase